MVFDADLKEGERAHFPAVARPPPSLASVMLQPVICLIASWGRREEHPDALDCEQLQAHVHVERRVLFESVHLQCVQAVHIWAGGGGGGGGQLCLVAINPQDVIHKLFTINSSSAYKCG